MNLSWISFFRSNIVQTSFFFFRQISQMFPNSGIISGITVLEGKIRQVSEKQLT